MPDEPRPPTPLVMVRNRRLRPLLTDDDEVRDDEPPRRPVVH